MKRTFITLGLLFASTALAVSTKSLPKADPVAAAVTDIAIEWNDGNISTGTSAASAASVIVPTTKDGWQTLAQELFAEELKAHTGDALPVDAKLRITSAAFAPDHLRRAVAAVAEGNAYDTSNPQNLEPIFAQAKTMVVSLGAEKDLHFLAVKTKLATASSSGEKRIVRIHAFVNVTTGKLVQIFTIEGTM